MRVPLTHRLAKAGTFAVVHSSVAFTIACLLAGSAGFASAPALIEPMANTVAYPLHERARERFTPRAASARARAVPQRIAETSC